MKNPWKRLSLELLFVLCCVSPCFAPAEEGQPGKTASNDVDQSAPLTDYRFVPGDAIEIKLFYNPDMNQAVQIRPDGKIALPLIGDVNLNGKTVAEASRMIEELYIPYLKTPKITILIRGYAAQKVYVGGEVLRPGVVNLSYKLTLLDAIMEAGGRKNTGSSAMVVLIRKTSENTPQIQKIPIKTKGSEFSDQAMKLLLLPYDIVLVPESKIAKLDRWIDQYTRQVVPITLYGSFSYILNPGVLK